MRNTRQCWMRSDSVKLEMLAVAIVRAFAKPDGKEESCRGDGMCWACSDRRERWQRLRRGMHDQVRGGEVQGTEVVMTAEAERMSETWASQATCMTRTQTKAESFLSDYSSVDNPAVHVHDPPYDHRTYQPHHHIAPSTLSTQQPPISCLHCSL